MQHADRAERPCPTCGGRSYTTGALHTELFTFLAYNAPWYMKLSTGGGWNHPARYCDDCGNIQFYPDRHPGSAQMEKIERQAGLPCPICGGQAYQSGYFGVLGAPFIGGDAPWYKRLLLGVRSRARRRLECGNIQLFMEPRRPRKAGGRRDADLA